MSDRAHCVGLPASCLLPASSSVTHRAVRPGRSQCRLEPAPPLRHSPGCGAGPLSVSVRARCVDLLLPSARFPLRPRATSSSVTLASSRRTGPLTVSRHKVSTALRLRPPPTRSLLRHLQAVDRRRVVPPIVSSLEMSTVLRLRPPSACILLPHPPGRGPHSVTARGVDCAARLRTPSASYLHCHSPGLRAGQPTVSQREVYCAALAPASESLLRHSSGRWARPSTVSRDEVPTASPDPGQPLTVSGFRSGQAGTSGVAIMSMRIRTQSRRTRIGSDGHPESSHWFTFRLSRALH